MYSLKVHKKCTQLKKYEIEINIQAMSANSYEISNDKVYPHE